MGAVKLLAWEQEEDVIKILHILKNKGISVVALEQSERAVPIYSFEAPQKLAVVLGTEVSGLPRQLLERIDTHVCIPMFGKKESFNVVQAAAMALYQFRFH